MTAVYLLMPLASAFISLSFGGASLPFALLFVFVFSAAVGSVGALRLRFLLPLLALSVVLRAFSLFEVSRGALTSAGAILFTAICIALSIVAAYKSESALRFAMPLAFIALWFAIFSAFVCFSSGVREPLGNFSVIESVASVACPISFCIAISHFSSLSRSKRICALAVGMLPCAVFILFDTGAAFSFLNVPFVILTAAVEIKAILIGINRIGNE